MPCHRPFTTLLAAVLVAACSGGADGDSEFATRMAAEHAGDRPVSSPMAASAPDPTAPSGPVVYARSGNQSITGYLARPESVAVTAGIVVIQEWWGLNDNIRAMADRLAAEGYLALAVDLYGGEVATDRDAARELMQRAMADEPSLRANLRQAVGYLEAAGAEKIGVLGWCFGGGWSLQTALALGDNIDAAVIYYGRVVTDPGELAALSAPVLGHFGQEDRGIPLESVRKFETALSELGKTATIHVYPGADHAFANPSGTRYQKEAAELAWGRTLAFFGNHLR